MANKEKTYNVSIKIFDVIGVTVDSRSQITESMIVEILKDKIVEMGGLEKFLMENLKITEIKNAQLVPTTKKD
jgi:uncharacterized Zn finger protein